ncbi:genetic competence negative regulator [Neobacillus niacini]|uniref:genetic competence negative regulator n=1 Tax=Neobacillus niacini TaxID=86668 RepID=UPI001C8DB734|nr:genetic competence negative regulator [Neobacillus niacini]MBY0145499.1 genetic competence negative regulator [Neobacillus niacini]
MRLERLTVNKIKIFLTSDDLMERGLSKDDIWKDSIKWHQLFHDMLEEASVEFDVEIQGSVAVEIFSLQAQGMIMIITVDENIEDEEEEVLFDGFVEMQVRVEGCENLLYQFESIENIIDLSHTLTLLKVNGGSLYSYNNRYYLLMNNIDSSIVEKIAAFLSEYGNPSILSTHLLAEYGNQIIENNAVETIRKYFK